MGPTLLRRARLYLLLRDKPDKAAGSPGEASLSAWAICFSGRGVFRVLGGMEEGELLDLNF